MGGECVCVCARNCGLTASFFATSLSLLRHALLGTFDTVSNITGALGAGVALLSLDHRFVAQRWTQLRYERPRGIVDGMNLGVNAFTNSIRDGGMGMLIRPLRSIAEEGSVEGFVRELGVGMALR